MLPRINRLNKILDINRVKREGFCFRSDSFSLLFLKKSQKEISRIGIIVSKKVSIKAIVRNRVKREYRRVLREFISELRTGYDILFLVKSNSVGKDKLNLKEEIEASLQAKKLLV